MSDPVSYNVQHRQGDTFSEVWTMKYNGTPVPFGGYTGVLQIRDDNDRLIYELSSATTGITLGTTDGTITVKLTREQSRLMPAETYYFDFYLDNGMGDTYTYVTGTWTITRRRGVV